MVLVAPASRQLQAQLVEGRAVIGDGAPFDAQPRSLGVQGWIQAAALGKLEKRAR